MLFSSITFLFLFLPLVMAVYFVVPMPKGSLQLRNGVLLAASLLFYAWGEPVYVLLMLGQCVSAWAFALLIHRWRSRPLGRVMLYLSAAVTLSGLIFFKYADFALLNLNALLRTQMPLLKLALPIGISFYTFQILSYSIDLHRGSVELQRNFLSFAAYVALFPQLMAGPIVRYADVAEALSHRRYNLEELSLGARRFVTGMAKKVLLANAMGQLADIYKQSDENSLLFAWLYIAAFALHVYFDFSGYSDMALGLGRMFGFQFRENFDYPYTARSITEFWRRWHISLGSWFRDYVYIPMGGNRVPAPRFILNIMVVWTLTGFWHGANWNYMVWGLYFGVILLIEKFLLKKLLPRLPHPLKHVYTMLLVFVGWAFFEAADLPSAFVTLRALFGGAGAVAGSASLYYLRSYALPLLVGAVGATPAPAKLARAWQEKMPRFTGVLEALAAAVLLALVTAFLVDGSFNPFIYFRF